MKTVAIPCLSLWQPYAQLLFTGDKIHETRSWRLPDRFKNKWVGIHATAKSPDVEPGSDLALLCVANKFGTLERSAIIGVVQFTGCERTEDCGPENLRDRTCGDFGPQRFAWRVGASHLFDRAVKASGSRQFWVGHVPADFLAALAA